MYDEQGKRPTISLMFGRRYTVNGHKLENIFDGNVSFFLQSPVHRRFMDAI